MFYTKTILAKHNLRAKKKLGQNFLQDDQALTSIVNSLGISKDDEVLEIGAGLGNLSALLAAQAKKFYALEIDKTLEPALKNALKCFDNTELIFSNILQFRLKDIFTGRKLIVVGNLPFYITSPILNHLIGQREYIQKIFITVQKEVGKRIIAKSGNKDYGRLTCLLQFYTKPLLLETFSRKLFFPKPNVDAALLRLDILDKPSVNVKSEKLFFSVVKAIFSHRRKILLNELLGGEIKLKKEIWLEILGRINILTTIRGEQLPLSEIAKIADAVFDYQNQQ